ncbi:uncharacterized protein LOC131330530 isoform X3 [Rhododendron vialii]|uniref:uncharacterized protein LOC131330530 isoform X3 n=1 Tax=Rhododendron vialii TaxID=182163 RepID=UPI00265FA524|nr:uncharacterized protein LOC131330530 isoform X3 [Rhododendron vialii]XP_058220133.1 uncharacterized protein LOC131330530 isoform X3 [Rhododendron vialii]XP_058220134.1 uncharacterized protein LOC131330530 isoform X3 [Rhododendron vialii]
MKFPPLKEKPSFFVWLFVQPPTEKVHQIIARTAVFVSKHGGQSEIVLRVKQGDNPTFGFLMPDHYLHAYFRFLVDHQDLVQSSTDGKAETEKKGNTESNQTDGVVAGALSLLGSVYGSGEDEDGADKDGKVAPESEEILSGKTFDASDGTVSVGFAKTDISRNIDGKNEAFGKHSIVSKEKFQIPKRNSFTCAPKSGTTNSTKKGETSGLLSTAVDISQHSAVSNVSQTEQLILEPPSELKKLVDKIVEFIVRNGKQFEAVLLEQDSKHGRFPFLLPSNQYHPYYVKVLQKAQELKLIGKSFISEKDDSVMNGLDKKTRLSKGSDSLSSGSAGYDIPYDADRKEKFRMVIGKSKKDGQDPPSQTTQPQFGVNVDAAAAAAILQAASRGIKNPNFGFFSNSTSLNGDSHGRNSEGEIRKSGDNTAPGSVAKDIAKTAALEAANEADSSEAHLTKEQRLKTERLKRAKKFVAMLKSGAAPGKTEPLRGLSVEPQETGVSTSGNLGFNLAGKEKEGISVPVDANNSAKKEKFEKYSDEYQERRSKRKYRSKSALDKGGRQEDDEDDDSEDEVEEKEKDRKKSRNKHRSRRSSREEGEEEEDKEERDYRYARRKHRSHHSSRQEDDEDERDHKDSRKKHRSYHSSEDDNKEEDYEDERVHKHSRKKHRSHRSSDDDEEDYEEERNRKHSRKKKHKSHSSSRHHRDRHKHKEGHRSSSKNKHESSSDEEHLHRDSSNKHRKISHSEEELEEGEISSKMSDKSRGSVAAGVSREASLDVSSSYRDGRAPSQPSEATEVSDELRAKIRAMLMANL